MAVRTGGRGDPDMRRQAKFDATTARAVGTKPELDALAHAETEAKKVIAEEKLRHFTDELTELDSRTHPTRIFGKIRDLSGTGKGSSAAPLRVDDGWITTPAKKAELFADHYANQIQESRTQMTRHGLMY
jgi:hypothetical protein